MCQKDSGTMAKSVDPDQTFRSSLIWVQMLHRDSRLRGTHLFSSIVFIFFQYACRTVRPDFRRLPIGIYIDKHVFIVP